MVVTGYDHTCTLAPDGSAVKCWGHNTFGQLGIGSTNPRGGWTGSMASLETVAVGPALSISAGRRHTCVQLAGGSVKCWGAGFQGQLGYDSDANLGDSTGEMTSLATVDLGSSKTVLAVSPSKHGHHTCAILNDGTVKCWGKGNSGRLGYDSTASKGAAAGDMEELATVSIGTVLEMSLGAEHTCALLSVGTVKCWGLGDDGRLGLDSTSNRGDSAGSMQGLAAVNLGQDRKAVAVSAGGMHTCAILDDGTVKCWGMNSLGQLGYDDTSSRGLGGGGVGQMHGLGTVNLGSGKRALAISAGYEHTCVVLNDHSVRCWGSGLNGRLGLDSLTNKGDATGGMASLVAVNLGVGKTALGIHAGGRHTCVALNDGGVKCWGKGTFGELGSDATADIGDEAGEMALLTAVQIGGSTAVRRISSGSEFACAVLSSGALKW